MDTTKTRPEGQNRKPRPTGDRPQGTKKRPEEAARKQRSQDGAVKQRPRQEAPQQTAAKKAPQKKKTAPKSSGLTRSRMTEAERNDVPNRKRAYGKSKPKKRSALGNLSLAMKATIQENAERKKAKAARSGKKRPAAPTPAIIYTQPQAFNRNRLVVQLVTVLAVVLALIMGMSVFFKVGKITVSGADVYTVNAVEEASGIKKGDGLFTFSRARAGALIIANLPYVKNVSFGIKLPETVNIIIEEEDVVYSIQDQTGGWWLMNSDGRVVTAIREGAASNYTKVLGVNLWNPAAGQRAEAMEKSDMVGADGEGAANAQTSADPNSTEETIVVASSGAQRLSVALEILKALEDNDVVGSAASVDVTQPENIELWYGTRYQVKLGDDNRLHDKIDYMTDVIAQMSDYQSGILDISFRIWTNQVGYTPFSAG